MQINYQYTLSTIAALLAFAGNSVLCRLALQGDLIDANSFTIIRLLSGAISLYLIVQVANQLSVNKEAIKTSANRQPGSWLNAFMLFLYAATFSFAYLMLDAGLGALILFACVQLCMISFSIFKKQTLSLLQYLGVLLALAGLAYLVWTQQQENNSSETVEFSLLGFGLMLISGIGWTVYTILGKQSQTPLFDTSLNFSRSCVFLLPMSLVFIFIDLKLTWFGFVLAVASGAITSGLGYAIWYYALNGLQAVQAGVVQLLVPVIAALGGVIWINEQITVELIISQLIILGGIALVLFFPAKKAT